MLMMMMILLFKCAPIMVAVNTILVTSVNVWAHRIVPHELWLLYERGLIVVRRWIDARQIMDAHIHTHTIVNMVDGKQLSFFILVTIYADNYNFRHTILYPTFIGLVYTLIDVNCTQPIRPRRIHVSMNLRSMPIASMRLELIRRKRSQNHHPIVGEGGNAQYW